MLRRIVAWTTVFLTISGCAEDDSPRFAIEGVVTLDGAALPSGEVRLRPLQSGPSTAGNITNGKFRIPRNQGPMAGEYRVEIVAYRSTGRQEEVPEAPGTWEDIMEQYVPERYNTHSELSIVVSHSTREFHLELQSNARQP